MTNPQAIELLSIACVAIWIECEKDEPNLEDIQSIAHEAIHITHEFSQTGKRLSDATGYESWLEYLKTNKLRNYVEVEEL